MVRRRTPPDRRHAYDICKFVLGPRECRQTASPPLLLELIRMPANSHHAATQRLSSHRHDEARQETPAPWLAWSASSASPLVGIALLSPSCRSPPGAFEIASSLAAVHVALVDRAAARVEAAGRRSKQFLDVASRFWSCPHFRLSGQQQPDSQEALPSTRADDFLDRYGPPRRSGRR